MQKEYIGTITKIRGYKGWLVISDLVDEIEKMPENFDLYIGFSSKFTQNYKLENWELKNKKAFLKIFGINDEINAKKLKEQGVFISKNDFSKLELRRKILNFTVDFDFFDENNILIGTIDEYWELPANDVWLVKTTNGDLTVPVLEENIIEINENKKFIKFRMLDGLLNLLNDDEE